MEPAEAVELVARMLEYRRYRDAGRALKEHFEASGVPLPVDCCRQATSAGRVETAERSMAERWRPRSAICSRPARPDLAPARPCLCAVAFRSSVGPDEPAGLRFR